MLDRYAAGPSVYAVLALAETTARGVVAALFDGAISNITRPGYPSGCLMVQGALASNADAGEIQAEMSARRLKQEQRLVARLTTAREDGDLPDSADPAALAGSALTVVRGMAVRAADGASELELRGVAAQALAVWPAERYRSAAT